MDDIAVAVGLVLICVLLFLVILYAFCSPEDVHDVMYDYAKALISVFREP